VEHRTRLHLLIALIAFSFTAQARVFMTQQQALGGAFDAGVKLTRQAIFLTPAQISAAKKASGVEFSDAMVVRYTGSNAAGVPVGYAYFDTHRVRTLPETVMVVIGADGKIAKVEILSFDEPPDYFPKQRWIDQFRGRKLDDELSLRGKVRPISGASLTGRAIMNASRKIFAIHQAIGAK
jgi:hypothetical protein